MDELVKLVVKKTGLPEAQAKTAVKTVIDYLKKNLPAPIAGQIDGLLNNAGALGQAEQLVKGLGGMLGQGKAASKPKSKK